MRRFPAGRICLWTCLSRYGKVVSVSELPGSKSDSTARQTSKPPVRPLSSDQQPATKADLYAAVDAMRADMRELLEQISTLIKDANKP